VIVPLSLPKTGKVFVAYPPPLVPASVLEEVIKGAFKLAAWACKADIKSQANLEFFSSD
jgi:hypothetical protein